MVATQVAEQQTGAENILWDLSIFYKGLDDPNIQVDMDKVERLADDFAAQYRGKVATLSADAMQAAVEALIAIYDLRGRIGSFAELNFTTNSASAQVGALVQKISEFDAVIGQKLVFFDLEWNAVDDAVAAKLLEAPVLATSRHYLEAERRYKPYQLSEIEEQVLMDKRVTGRDAWERFFTQLNGAMRFDFDGEKLNMSQVMVKVRDGDRTTRQKGADALTAGLRDKSMELTYVFNVLAADKASDDSRRQYPTWVSSRNLNNKAPDAVVEALISTVTANYELVAKHYRLKRVLMGLDELFDYDRYAPLPIKQSEKFYTWDEAREIVVNAFHAFNPRMAEIAQRFFDENWIHAPVLPGKRSGAFASPTVPSAHPFVFLNYTGQANDVMTLAHELGHGIHMYLSSEKHGLLGLHTPLTTAEMASVFAEMLVFSDLMSKEDDAEVRLAMLLNKIEDTFATVFRQISMNRFEDLMHNARRNEGELSTARLSELWLQTQRAMFKDSVTLRDDYGIWWSYI
ncbi:MAG TPA: M3 family oligoendopeptidase, partial [Phototrophicaceae bacterium]|nr:M3 family oligoendopeptidase [Phototrophicaceae bacterium]